MIFLEHNERNYWMFGENSRGLIWYLGILSSERISSDFRGNWQMKDETEMKIKKSATFRIANRSRLQDENICFLGYFPALQ